jgi:hypothetical protein|tara:strand:+ start:3488 stop:3952 length:465 start_codon:yes stop_codon:yes gene_type:complete
MMKEEKVNAPLNTNRLVETIDQFIDNKIEEKAKWYFENEAGLAYKEYKGNLHELIDERIEERLKQTWAFNALDELNERLSTLEQRVDGHSKDFEEVEYLTDDFENRCSEIAESVENIFDDFDIEEHLNHHTWGKLIIIIDKVLEEIRYDNKENK